MRRAIILVIAFTLVLAPTLGCDYFHGSTGKPPKFVGGSLMPRDYLSRIDDPKFTDRWYLEYNSYYPNQRIDLRIEYFPGDDIVRGNGFELTVSSDAKAYYGNFSAGEAFKDLIGYLKENEEIFCIDSGRRNTQGMLIVPKSTKEYFNLYIYPKNETGEGYTGAMYSTASFVVAGKEAQPEVKYVIDLIIDEFWEPLRAFPRQLSKQ